MPTYDYQCTTCGKRFDVTQSIKADTLTHCLESVCEQTEKGKGLVERVISGGSGVIYTGEGFYLTDYVHKPGSSKDKAAKAESGNSESSDASSTGSADSTSKESGASREPGASKTAASEASVKTPSKTPSSGVSGSSQSSGSASSATSSPSSSSKSPSPSSDK